MSSAGWVDVWHLIVAIWSRQPPFIAILMATGAVFVPVMALEGVRSSVIAIWRGHRPPAQGPAEPPVALAAAAPISAPPTKSFSARSVSRASAIPMHRPKALTVTARRFRSPRPTIRRHPVLDLTADVMMPNFAADTPAFQGESV